MAKIAAQIFEPEIMKRKFLTLEDKEIKLKDVPERIQVWCRCRSRSSHYVDGGRGHNEWLRGLIKRISGTGKKPTWYCDF
jgi:hypothetical protein